MNELFQQWLNTSVIGKLVVAVVTLVIVLIATRFLKNSITRYVKDIDTRYRLRKFINFSSYILIILVLMVIFSDQLGNFSVALGVAGAGIAFALQEVIASFAGWFAITFAGFYKPGDRVELGGIKGDVIDIGFLRTTLMEVGEWVSSDLYSGRIVLVANSFVFKSPVFNYSGDFPFLWDEITVPVKYGSDHRMAKTILEKITQKELGEYSTGAHTRWVKFSRQYLLEEATVEPLVTLALNDNWMEFTVRYVVDFKSRRKTKDLLFMKILDEFEQSNGSVRIASTTLQLVDIPPLDVRFTNDREK
ncbi:MAG: mechanosensitive ion channel [Acidobacteria bacterium]|nr:mechanosensitive ion channel [Acidobacteriota bacterium]